MMHQIVIPAHTRSVYITDSQQPNVEFSVEQHALLQIITVLNESSVALQHAITVKEYGSLEYIYAATGGNHTLALDIQLSGQQASANVRGAYALSGNETIAIQSKQHHTAAHTQSTLLIKGALAGNARAIYKGAIAVDNNAVQTQASQKNTNLMLSEQAQALSEPTLEVLTNDVQCAHGSAIGQLDEQQMLYMQSRGIAREDARALLLEGFFAEILHMLPNNSTVLEAITQKMKASIV